MGLKRLHTVATAAVRDASNGKAFLKQVGELGLEAAAAVAATKKPSWPGWAWSRRSPTPTASSPTLAAAAWS